MCGFLEISEGIACNHVAFCKVYSTVKPLISSTDFWYENMDESMINLTICLDLNKANDTVDHVIYLAMLLACRIRGKAGDWFESYQNNIKQFCSLTGQHSKATEVTCGIPQ